MRRRASAKQNPRRCKSQRSYHSKIHGRWYYKHSADVQKLCHFCATYQMPKVYTDHIPPLKVPQQYATFGKAVNPRDIVKVAGALLIPHEDEKSRRAKMDKFREALEVLEETVEETEKWLRSNQEEMRKWNK